MADMDLDELDGPIRAPPRTSRFAPKASKLKPKPKPKSEPQSVPIPPPKPEPESEPSISSVSEAVEMDVQAKAVDDAVKMDIKEGEADDSGKDSAVEENDCVVREIDVFFNPVIDPATQLYALQYPLRPCWRPYELEERCVEVRLKPTSNEVEIDLSLDADSKNYDTDGDRKMSMKKETLSSSMKPVGAKGIAIGMLMGNKLHINPIRAAVQLRPSRKSAVSMKKTGVPRNKDDIVKSEDLKDEKSPGPSRKQLQNKPPGIPNEDDDIVEEDWIPLKHYPANSEFSARYLGKMAGTESSPIQFSMSTYNYINSMCPGANSDYNKPIGIALRSLHSLPLEERFGTWLREHPPANRFATLKHLAPDDSIEDVFNALQKVACLVQGLWVPKSAVLLGGGLEVLARDYVLLLFCRSPTISYNQLDNLKPKVSKAIKGVLSTLANDRSTLRDWKFKETPDTTFVKLYPDIVIQQEQNWKRVEKQITETLLGPERAAAAGKPPLKADLASKAGAPKTSSSKATARSSSGVVSRTPMSDETREALPKALLKLFHTHKVCSFQVICQRLREMAVSESARPKGMAREAIAAANAVDGPQEELMEIINQVATNIHGVYVLKKSPDDPQSDPLRKVVIDLLLAEGPNAKLKKASVLAAAKMQLKKDVSDPEYNKVLKELCVSQGATWVLKRGDGNPIPK